MAVWLVTQKVKQIEMLNHISIIILNCFYLYLTGMPLFNIPVNRLNHSSRSNLVNQFNHTSHLNPIDSITSHYEKWIDSIKSNQKTAASNQSIQSTWLVYNPGGEGASQRPLAIVGCLGYYGFGHALFMRRKREPWKVKESSDRPFKWCSSVRDISWETFFFCEPCSVRRSRRSVRGVDGQLHSH